MLATNEAPTYPKDRYYYTMKKKLQKLTNKVIQGNR